MGAATFLLVSSMLMWASLSVRADNDVDDPKNQIAQLTKSVVDCEQASRDLRNSYQQLEANYKNLQSSYQRQEANCKKDQKDLYECNASASASKAPLYRYFSKQIDDNLYTSNAAEIQTTTCGWKGNFEYVFQGVTCRLQTGPGVNGGIPLYRYISAGKLAF